jgi:hypothetical protein
MSYAFAGQAPVFLLTSWQKAGAYFIFDEGVTANETKTTDSGTDTAY